MTQPWLLITVSLGDFCKGHKYSEMVPELLETYYLNRKLKIKLPLFVDEFVKIN